MSHQGTSKKKGATKKQFELLNQAVLIEYESRFCYCMPYFSHEWFPETYFSSLFNSYVRLVFCSYINFQNLEYLTFKTVMLMFSQHLSLFSVSQLP